MPSYVAPVNRPSQFPIRASKSIQEHRKLFKPYNTSRKRPYNQARVHNATLKFVCLGYADDTKPPNSISDKTALSNVGLGPASITMDMEGDAGHCKEKILAEYPLLRSTGGYELMLYQRGGNTKGFHRISEPHLPRKLKDLANQSQIYIVPMETILDDQEGCDISEVRVNLTNDKFDKFLKNQLEFVSSSNL